MDTAFIDREVRLLQHQLKVLVSVPLYRRRIGCGAAEYMTLASSTVHCRLGTRNAAGQFEVPFGKLYDATVDIFEALAGTLKVLDILDTNKCRCLLMLLSTTLMRPPGWRAQWTPCVAVQAAKKKKLVDYSAPLLLKGTLRTLLSLLSHSTVSVNSHSTVAFCRHARQGGHHPPC